MEHIALFVDAAAPARRLIEPLVRHHDIQWTVVACPPRLSRHAGRWVTHAGREQWQRKWLNELRAELEPGFGPRSSSGTVRWLLARAPLHQIAQRLQSQHGPALRLLDARQPRMGRVLERLAGAAGSASERQWPAPVAVSSSVALMLALAD